MTSDYSLVYFRDEKDMRDTIASLIDYEKSVDYASMPERDYRRLVKLANYLETSELRSFEDPSFAGMVLLLPPKLGPTFKRFMEEELGRPLEGKLPIRDFGMGELDLKFDFEERRYESRDEGKGEWWDVSEGEGLPPFLKHEIGLDRERTLGEN